MDPSPPCWDKFPTLTVYFFWRLPLDRFLDDTTDNVIGEEGPQGNEDIAEDINNDSVVMFDDSFDVPDESIDDMTAALGEGTEATINEDNEGDEIITIVDDDTPTGKYLLNNLKLKKF